MKFKDILDLVLQGKRVCRSSWKGTGVYVYLDNGVICISDKKGVGFPFVLGIDELLSEDWEIIS